MTKENKCKIVIGVFIWILISLILVGMTYTPDRQVRNSGIEIEDTLLALGVNDICDYNMCTVSEDGFVHSSGDDSFVIFNKCDVEANYVIVRFKEPVSKDIEGKLYIDYGEGMSEATAVSSLCMAGQDKLNFDFELGQIKQLRIDIDDDYKFASIECHKKTSDLITVSEETEVKWIPLSIIIAGIISVVICFILSRFGILDLFINFLMNNWKKIGINCLALILIVAICNIICLLMNNFKANFVIIIFLSGIACSGFILYRLKESWESKPEKIVASLMLVLGITITMVMPFAHVSWDIESHYRWSVDASYMGQTEMTEADREILVVPTNFLYVPNNFEENQREVNLANSKYTNIVERQSGYFSLAHVPAGLLIAVFRLLGLDYYWIYTLGKLPNLLIYVATIYFGMKRLHSGKMILAVIGAIPTSIFIACNYSYDYWVTGFSLLGMAYFIGMCQEKDKLVSLKDTVIMCVAFALACVPKAIYIAFLLVPFLMPLKKIKNKKLYYIICSCSFILLFSLLMVKTSTATTSVGDTRGGSGVNSAEQVKFILSQPFVYLGILINFLKGYLSWGNMTNYISNFAYLGISSGSIVFQILAIFTALTDKSEYDEKSYTWLSRVYVVLMYLGEAALVATALYISFTEVGAGTVAGCQARYIIPIIYPLISIICGKGIWQPKNKSIYNIAVTSILFGVLYFDVYSMMVVRML